MEGHYNKAKLAKELKEKLPMIKEQTEAKKKQALAIFSDIKALELEYQAKLASLQGDYENVVAQFEFCEGQQECHQ
jgi:hypothetical protein